MNTDMDIVKVIFGMRAVGLILLLLVVCGVVSADFTVPTPTPYPPGVNPIGIPVSVVNIMMVATILLTLFALWKFEDIYTPMIAVVMSSLISFSIGYCYLYGLVISESVPAVQYTDAGIGYLFLILGVIQGVILFLLFLYRNAVENIESVIEVQG
jgi:hypothetical protein